MKTSKLYHEIYKVMRFLGVGVFMTIAGYLLFILFYDATKISYNLANSLSYLVMILCAFLIYKNVVFKDKSKLSSKQIFSYFASATTAFLCNLLFLNILTYLGFDARIAQVGAMGSYSIAFYFLSRFIVFK